MDRTEFKELLERLDIPLEAEEVERMFVLADSDGSGGVGEEEFKEIYYKHLSRGRNDVTELLEVFRGMKKSHKPGILLCQLQTFLKESQSVDLNIQEVEDLVRNHQKVVRMKTTYLTWRGFQELTLSSPCFSLNHKKETKEGGCPDQPSQDMTQPLAHYFINR